jgi:hypothetical protein
MSAPKPALGAPLPCVESPPLIVERNDGKFQIGIDDETAAGPFETRNFAEAVRLRHTRHLPWAARQ